MRIISQYTIHRTIYYVLHYTTHYTIVYIYSTVYPAVYYTVWYTVHVLHYTVYHAVYHIPRQGAVPVESDLKSATSGRDVLREVAGFIRHNSGSLLEFRGTGAAGNMSIQLPAGPAREMMYSESVPAIF